jgi:hypothetical protein
MTFSLRPRRLSKSKTMEGASPRRFRPRYPDFLHGAPPTPACARPVMWFAYASVADSPKKIKVRVSPHLAKNERDMGHPSFLAGTGERKAAIARGI